jgi:hypothetical protein
VIYLDNLITNQDVTSNFANQDVTSNFGHITVVAPEHDGFRATGNAAGEVLRPPESQAGRMNHRFFVNTRRWWLGSNFCTQGFWRRI